MCKKKSNIYQISVISLTLFLCIIQQGLAQEIRVEFSSTKIALNEAFYISVESVNQAIDKIGNFPEIEGLKKIKGGVANANSTSTFQGKTTTTYIITQTYHPTQEGDFVVKPFIIEVNGKKIESFGIKISVGAIDPKKGELIEFDLQRLNESEKKFVDVQEDAFLGLNVDKEAVFVGEGIHVSLALYVSASNTAPMKFLELGTQVEEITKQLKPSNCWEENFNIREIPEAPLILINGKAYNQKKFYEATFFPINDQQITFPKVGLKMIVAKKIDINNPNNFDEQNNSILKYFYSSPLTIHVKPLPPHPLKDKIVVGNFYLQENYPYQALKTGTSFTYSFQIVGQGNIAAIHSPEIHHASELEFYATNTQQFINRGQGKVNGTMRYDFQVIPKDSGVYQFDKYFEWIYFNLNKQKYDTLRSKAIIQVSGESVRNSEINAVQFNKFYKKINNIDKNFQTKPTHTQTKFIVIIILLVLVLATIALLFYK